MFEKSSHVLNKRSLIKNRLESYYIGGSDANLLMAGKLVQLYMRKKNLKLNKHIKSPNTIPKQTSAVATKIGMCTEDINLDFLQKSIEQEIHRKITVDPDDKSPWLRSSLDGMTDETHTPCEAKHTNQFTTFEDVVIRYYPQLQHYLFHTQKDSMYLSVFFGNNTFLYASIDADYKYQKILMDTEEWFYMHLIENKIPTSANSYIARINIKNKIKTIDIKNPFNSNFIYKKPIS